MKHANLSIFIPHLGCPHQCSFCNQHMISNRESLPNAAYVKNLCETTMKAATKDRVAEIAFFGGSFTAIDRGYMKVLLEAAFPFIENGEFQGIRISTRPDAIDEEILTLLKRYHVTAIELGAQSMDAAVLCKNGRGHTIEDVEKSANQIKKWGFSLGLQMMTGLYGSSPEKDWDTARQLAAYLPDSMRIYPTLVLQKTMLEKAFLAGDYQPQTLSAAVELCAGLLGFFEEKNISVIRVGLHDEPSLKAALVAGPYHPAFRELCQGRLMADRIALQLQDSISGVYRVAVSPGAVSKMLGHGGFSVEYLRRLGYNVTIKVDPALSGLEFRIEDVENATTQFGNTRI